MKLWGRSLSILISLSCLIVGSASFAQSNGSTITPNVTSCLNFRTAPNGREISCLRYGEQMKVLKRQGSWLKVRHNGRSGYVYSPQGQSYTKVLQAESSLAVKKSIRPKAKPTTSASQVQETQSPEAQETDEVQETVAEESAASSLRPQARPQGLVAEEAQVDEASDPEPEARVSTSNPVPVGQILTPDVSSCLYFRAQPSSEGKPQACIRPGVRMEVTDQRGEWTKIKLPDDREGWVSTQYTKETIEIPEGQGAEQLAINLSGRGVNCSKSDTNPVKCLACNMYWEARGESKKGRKAISYVVFNRVTNGSGKGFKNNICEVIWQDNGRGKNNAQFSWTDDGKSDWIPKRYYESMQDEAVEVLNEYLSGQLDPSIGAVCADHYANVQAVKDAGGSAIRPGGWLWKLLRTSTVAKVGKHTFMRAPGAKCFDGTDSNYQRLAQQMNIPASSREIADNRNSSSNSAPSRSLN